MRNTITKSIIASSIALMGWSANSIAGTGTIAPGDTVAAHKIGDAFGGGIIFQITKGADGKEHGLIVSADNLGKAPFSANTSQDIGASSTSDGAANTAACIKAGVAKTDAAGLCDAYEKDGFTDWFLPAIDQLQTLYKAIKTEKTPGPQFSWSSTSAHPGSATGLEFNDGTSTDSNKHRPGIVRAVRAF
jgi:hypothetical protein